VARMSCSARRKEIGEFSERSPNSHLYKRVLNIVIQFFIVLSNITAFATLRSLTLQIGGPHVFVSGIK